MRLLQYAAFGFICSTVIGVMLVASLVMLMPSFDFKVEASDLSSKEKIMSRNNTGLILLDRKGDVFYSFYQARHLDPTPLKDVPLHTREAILAAEDKEFYVHSGYSIKAVLGSAIANLRQQEAAYGGSTITQQLAKTAFLTPEKSWQRKVQELLLARELETKYSKDEILEMYVNSVYFGEGAFGIEDASETYFSKPVQELSIAQSALLAGLLTAPSNNSPISGDKDAAISRQRTVLEAMTELGAITEAEHQTALKADLGLQPSAHVDTYQAPHFALLVRQQLIDEYGEQVVAHSGYVVRTTIDLDWQQKAEKAVKEQVAKLAKNKVTNGAAVVIEPRSGEVRALVGSKDWNTPGYGKFNVATAPRQPGSSFKPIVYLAGLEKQTITPATVLKDAPTNFGGGYKPQNYDGRFRGNVTVRRSLSNSLNIPTVEIQKRIGVPSTLDMANRLGLTSLTDFSPNDLSVSLGAGEVKLLEMTNAYATFARSGSYLPAVTYTQIVNKEGKTIYTYTPAPKQAVEAKYAYLLTSILSDNNARKEIFGNSITISRPAAVKTGTSNDYKDSWTMGYSPSLAVGVWVGNNDGALMDRVAGSLGAAPIWKTLMEQFMAGSPVENFTKPADVVQLTVCKTDGQRAPKDASGDEYYREYFAKGGEPAKECAAPTPSPTPVLEEVPVITEPTPNPEATPQFEEIPMGGEPNPQPLPTLTPSPAATQQLPSPKPKPTAKP